MAVEMPRYFGRRKRKRGSGNGKRKLRVNERVEVRSVEDGFLGSWHPGTVTLCGKQKRHVRYDNILDDDGLNYLIEVVGVPAVLDGVSSLTCNGRGLIRPLPPLMEFGSWELRYGLCVDVNYQEAWWEGVIFDHDDGMEERRIFFPDIGDEMKIGIDQLRITHDWDEVTENWERRGNWVFLELVEECEQASYVAVSVKQIWYDVRAKKDFGKIRDWTFKVKNLWRDLVMDVIGDYFTLTLKELIPVLEISKGFLEKALEPESVEPTADVHHDTSPNNIFGSNIRNAASPKERGDSPTELDTDPNQESITPIQERYDMHPLDGVSTIHFEVDLKISCPEKEVLLQDESVPPVDEMIPQNPEKISCYDSGATGEVVSGSRCYEKIRKFKGGTSSVYWKLLILPGAEFCPDAVNEYVAAHQRKTKELLKTKVRKHLAFLGWKIEFREIKTLYNQRQYKYTSPDDQKFYMSLCQVCKHLKNETSMISLPSLDNHIMMHPSPDSSVLHLHLEQPENSQDPDIFPTVVPPPPVKLDVNPEYFPQAVVEYYMMALNKSHKAVKKNMILKAKEQLLSAGWILSYGCKTRKQLTYTSPKQRTYHSLRRACGGYIKESISNLNISGLRPSDTLGINEDSIGQIGSDNLLHQLLQKEPELLTRNGKRKRKRLRNLKASLPKVEEKEFPSRVLRSTKRVQKVHAPCLSHQKPLNVLSWLIDSNMVLPRAKVYYQARGRPRSKSEGRITRDGIKCNCCLKVYSLGAFEGHASGSISRRPAVSIFFEDGRSLLDIQMQIMHDHQKREPVAKPSSDWHQAENDGICSVCRYGGDLILCDQCPSSFHKDCLGLEDIPDGDWFCPSCQCGICGQSKIEGAEDGTFLTCSQCEHKYHLWCLQNGGVDKSRRYAKNWFCGKNCEKIYAGLHKLVGEPFIVGENNLKWTLMKWVNSDSCPIGCNNNHFLAESYCKLNVALGLMHECFETLKEPISKRDLMEDVLFSRWTKLKRLNFQGFYSILLERDDELISVATLRVYGEKVAEVPLVGTRVQYRRHGMCRVLMNELEKKLKQLGVERLVLPAAPVALDTWTTYFGFSKMTNSERTQFLDYTFLDFQQAIMCQKLLTKIPSQDSVLSRETKRKSRDILSVSRNIDFDGSSSLSEVHQAEDITVCGIPDPQLVDNVAANNDSLGKGVIDPVTMQPTLQGEQYQNVTNSECSAEDVSFEQAEMNDGSFKYYRRRKLAGGD